MFSPGAFVLTPGLERDRAVPHLTCAAAGSGCAWGATLVRYCHPRLSMSGTSSGLLSPVIRQFASLGQGHEAAHSRPSNWSALLVRRLPVSLSRVPGGLCIAECR